MESNTAEREKLKAELNKINAEADKIKVEAVLLYAPAEKQQIENEGTN